MFRMHPGNARRNTGVTRRMNPARQTSRTSYERRISTRRVSNSSRRSRRSEWSRYSAGMPWSRARTRPYASALLLMTTPTFPGDRAVPGRVDDWPAGSIRRRRPGLRSTEGRSSRFSAEHDLRFPASRPDLADHGCRHSGLPEMGHGRVGILRAQHEDHPDPHVESPVPFLLRQAGPPRTACGKREASPTSTGL